MLKWKLFFALYWQIILWLPPPIIRSDLVPPDRSTNAEDREIKQIRRFTAAVIGPGTGFLLRKGRGGIAPT